MRIFRRAEQAAVEQIQETGATVSAGVRVAAAGVLAVIVVVLAVILVGVMRHG